MHHWPEAGCHVLGWSQAALGGGQGPQGREWTEGFIKLTVGSHKAGQFVGRAQTLQPHERRRSTGPWGQGQPHPLERAVCRACCVCAFCPVYPTMSIFATKRLHRSGLSATFTVLVGIL